MAERKIALGYKFRPSDEVLITHYLFKRVMGEALPCQKAIAERDLYGEEPWEIYGNSTSDVYFFTTLKGSGGRKTRTAGQGKWKETISKKPISDSSGREIGIFKAYKYVSLLKDSSNDNRWIMHEFSLGGHFEEQARAIFSKWDCNEIVVCMLRDKNAKNTHCLEEEIEDWVLSLFEAPSSSSVSVILSPNSNSDSDTHCLSPNSDIHCLSPNSHLNDIHGDFCFSLDHDFQLRDPLIERTPLNEDDIPGSDLTHIPNDLWLTFTSQDTCYQQPPISGASSSWAQPSSSAPLGLGGVNKVNCFSELIGVGGVKKVNCFSELMGGHRASQQDNSESISNPNPNPKRRRMA